MISPSSVPKQRCLETNSNKAGAKSHMGNKTNVELIPEDIQFP